MKLSSSTSFTLEETSDALLFLLVREPGAIERIGLPLFATVILWRLWISGTFLVQCFVVLAAVPGCITYVASWLQGKQAILRVTADKFVARGNLARTFTTEIVIAADDVRSLEWESGGENGTSGLYAKQEWGSTLLLPYIDEAQAAEIRAAVARRFPEIQIDDDSAASFLYGDKSGITTLGLHQPRDETPQTTS